MLKTITPCDSSAKVSSAKLSQYSKDIDIRDSRQVKILEKIDTLVELAQSDLFADSQKEFQKTVKKLRDLTVLEAEKTRKRIDQVNEENTNRAHVDKVLQSLNFSTLNAREEQIDDAFPKTLDWVFDSKPSYTRSWSDLVNWAERGEGIYWVNGKVGSGKSTVSRPEKLSQISQTSQTVSTAFCSRGLY